MSGSGINRGVPILASIAYPLQRNVFIIGAVDDGYLKMVKIRVLEKTRFEWIDAKYYIIERYTTLCISQEVFTEDCYYGTTVSDPEYYNVELLSEINSGTQKQNFIASLSKKL